MEETAGPVPIQWAGAADLSDASPFSYDVQSVVLRRSHAR
jgi:hypothetical protein